MNCVQRQYWVYGDQVTYCSRNRQPSTFSYLSDDVSFFRREPRLEEHRYELFQKGVRGI